MLITKILINVRKIVKNQVNVENLKFIKFKNRHLKYASL
jgi:hypothetical protein